MKNVFLICGKMRSGKNKFASYLEESLKSSGYIVSTDMFAKDLKANCEIDFTPLSNVLNKKAEEIYSLVNVFFSHHLNDHNVYVNEINRVIDSLRVSHPNWYENKTDITRTLLQTYGEDIFRNRVDPDYWAKSVEARVIESDSDCIIITDTRHPNEIDIFDNLIHDGLRIVVIKVERDDCGKSNHQSETSMDGYLSYDYIVDNNGTLEALKDSAKEIQKDLALLSRK